MSNSYLVKIISTDYHLQKKSDSDVLQHSKSPWETKSLVPEYGCN